MNDDRLWAALFDGGSQSKDFYNRPKEKKRTAPIPPLPSQTELSRTNDKLRFALPHMRFSEIHERYRDIFERKNNGEVTTQNERQYLKMIDEHINWSDVLARIEKTSYFGSQHRPYRNVYTPYENVRYVLERATRNLSGVKKIFYQEVFLGRSTQIARILGRVSQGLEKKAGEVLSEENLLGVKDCFGFSLMHLCVLLGNLELTRQLLKTFNMSVNVATRGQFCQMPLHFSCELNDDRMTALLLECGARVDVLNTKFRSPLSIVLRLPEPDIRLIRRLVVAGSSLLACSEISRTLADAKPRVVESPLSILFTRKDDLLTRDDGEDNLLNVVLTRVMEQEKPLDYLPVILATILMSENYALLPEVIARFFCLISKDLPPLLQRFDLQLDQKNGWFVSSDEDMLLEKQQMLIAALLTVCHQNDDPIVFYQHYFDVLFPVLFWVFQNSSIHVIELMLKPIVKKIDPKFYPLYFSQLLKFASAKASIPKFDLIIRLTGMHVDQAFEHAQAMWTSLHMAALFDKTGEFIDYLLGSGANVLVRIQAKGPTDEPPKWLGNTILHTVLQFGAQRDLKRLLSDPRTHELVNIPNANGELPFDLALQVGTKWEGLWQLHVCGAKFEVKPEHFAFDLSPPKYLWSDDNTQRFLYRLALHIVTINLCDCVKRASTAYITQPKRLGEMLGRKHYGKESQYNLMSALEGQLQTPVKVLRVVINHLRRQNGVKKAGLKTTSLDSFLFRKILSDSQLSSLLNLRLFSDKKSADEHFTLLKIYPHFKNGDKRLFFSQNQGQQQVETSSEESREAAQRANFLTLLNADVENTSYRKWYKNYLLAVLGRWLRYAEQYELKEQYFPGVDNCYLQDVFTFETDSENSNMTMSAEF